MIFPDNFENKIGFTAVREAIKSYCTCDDAKSMVTAISFCTDFSTVNDSLTAVSEYLESLTADTDSHLPLDLLPQRSMAETTARLRLQGSTLDTEQIDALRRTLQCTEQVNAFFNTTRQEGSVSWPQLERLVADLVPY